MGNKKLILDIVMGAAIPLAILKWGGGALQAQGWSEMAGQRAAFITAGLIPALYVLWDVFFYTKRFNAITTVVAITAVTQGGTSLFKVQGVVHALQDTSGTIVNFLLFAGSLMIGRPIVQYFAVQVLEPKPGKEESLVWKMILSPGPVRKSVYLGTLLVLTEQVVRGVANFLVNWYRVTADFGTSDFTSQKASVGAMLMFPFMITSMGALILAVGMVLRAVDNWLYDVSENGGTLGEQIERKLAPPPAPVAAQQA